MTPDTQFNHPAEGPIMIYKRQIGPIDCVAEAVEFGHGNFELERLIL